MLYKSSSPILHCIRFLVENIADQGYWVSQNKFDILSNQCSCPSRYDMSPDFYLMSGQRRRRWSNIKWTPKQRLCVCWVSKPYLTKPIFKLSFSVNRQTSFKKSITKADSQAEIWDDSFLGHFKPWKRSAVKYGNSADLSLSRKMIIPLKDIQSFSNNNAFFYTKAQ